METKVSSSFVAAGSVLKTGRLFPGHCISNSFPSADNFCIKKYKCQSACTSYNVILIPKKKLPFLVSFSDRHNNHAAGENNSSLI